ncbi:MAG TPA: hypothetical protein DEQ80_01290 [Anaerolinea thermolimosa]|uniref:Peptidase M19 n=1 Tax=Anaerolinea thermolimosa TaxID=229919 RepID=A0A3D1JD06_9CHLR|nr:hypothetical protein [Anaerolinea thermolimosa]
MSFPVIDAHEDLAYNALTFGRDYLQSALETRRREQDSAIPQRNGHCMLGWPEYQQGQVALVIATLFIAAHGTVDDWESQTYRSSAEARLLWEKQIAYYQRLCGDFPDRFRWVCDRQTLREHFARWKTQPATLPDENTASSDGWGRTHPVGLTLLMENAEGLHTPAELEEWRERGVRLVGPVWAPHGERFCGGSQSRAGFTREGYELLEVMAGLGLILDISHMNERSALQALDRYEGPVAATHANCRALLRVSDNERHFSDRVIRQLIERDGVMGVSPFARWLRPGWSPSDDPAQTTFSHLVAHIDHVCQIAGDARHVGLGTDFDGGWGWPAVPQGMNTIADLQKLPAFLAEAGFATEDIAAVMGENWAHFLERSLAET